MFCYKHPNMETLLCCGKCERPICPKCTKYGPVGVRCPDCASIKSSPLYQIDSKQLAIGCAVGTSAAFILGFLLAMFSSMGFFLLWGGFLGGGLVGEVFLRVTSRKRGPKMEIAVGVCTAIGIILSFFVRWQSLVFAVEGADIMIALQMHPFYVISAGLVVFAAVGKVRFFS